MILNEKVIDARAIYRLCLRSVRLALFIPLRKPLPLQDEILLVEYDYVYHVSRIVSSLNTWKVRQISIMMSKVFLFVAIRIYQRNAIEVLLRYKHSFTSDI